MANTSDTPKAADLPKKKLAVIDGKSVFYRGYYAMTNLATKDGTPTGGVFGFATMALEVLKLLKPDYVAVAWDKPKTNIRRRLELYPEYKAGRKPAPEDFKAQIPVLHELLQAFGWPLYELDDYEADDIMGALAVQASAKGIDTMLITSDLDMLQLVNENVHVYALKKGLSNIELYSPKSFEAKYGITVDQFLDLKALKGDSSDNIPGVPGIGEKGAIQLLQQFKTLDGVYENLPLIKDSLAKKLVAGRESAYLSKQLAAIWTDAPLPLDLESMDGSKADPHRIQELLTQLEFKNLARQLPAIMHIAEEDMTPIERVHLKKGKNTIVESDDALSEVSQALQPAKQVVLHSRAAGKHGAKPQLLVVSPSPGQVFTLVLEKLDGSRVRDALQPALADTAKAKIGHDIKSTLQVCYRIGLDVQGTIFDTQIAGFLLNALRRDLTLTGLAAAEIDYAGSPFEDSDIEELASRAADIVAVIHALADKQHTELQQIPKLADLGRDVEFPVISVLARMEYAGMLLDTSYLKDFAVEIDDLISDYEQQIYGLAEHEFNIGSPTQLAEVLFTTLKLPTAGIKKGKTGYSTAASELDKLRGQHEIIDLITQFREVAKLKNTYVDTLPTQVDAHSRVHTTFAMTVAQTGRLSSNDPNLQNIPTRTDLGRRIRTAFIADKGKKLVSADYSQFELRLAAVMADDKELISMFNRGADIHTATAALVYGRELEDVTKNMRRAAKVINFGILYGMSPHGLQIATGMDRQQAVMFIERYKKVRRPLFDYIDRTRELARQQGYVETLLGRRRPMPDIHSANFVVRQAAERAAINMPIQGTEADLMKMAMIKVDQLLAEQFPAATQLMQVHDSILVEAPEPDAEAVGELLKTTMQDIYKLPVRLDVDVTIGDNWGEL
jgi:DNA polymerase-1